MGSGFQRTINGPPDARVRILYPISPTRGIGFRLWREASVSGVTAPSAPRARGADRILRQHAAGAVRAARRGACARALAEPATVGDRPPNDEVVAPAPALPITMSNYRVHTPEGPLRFWAGLGGRHMLHRYPYNHSFRVDGASSKEESLARAEQTGFVCADEMLLHAGPHAGRERWCRACRSHRAVHGCPCGRHADRAVYRPLVRVPNARTAPSLVHPMVWDRAGCRLAPSLRQCRGGLRSAAHPASEICDGVSVEEVSTATPARGPSRSACHARSCRGRPRDG